MTVEFAQTIDPETNARVHALDRTLRAKPPPGMIEAMPTYSSLLVTYDPVVVDFADIAESIRQVLATMPAGNRTRARAAWSVPVVYGGEHGFDLLDVARHVSLSPEEVVARHITSMFEVFMIGFLPGFTYLGGLDPVLAIPRRPVPRQCVPAGSIVIGGIQAAIGSIEGPSGWHVIGRTPVRTFQVGRDPVVFFEPGDEVIFESRPATSFADLSAAAAAGQLVAERIE